LSKEDMGVMCVRTMGERLMLARLISELKAEWETSMGGTGSGVALGGGGGGGEVEGVRGSMIVMMEDGKGAPMTDAPPSYSDS
jgi:hypothetical protein